MADETIRVWLAIMMAMSIPAIIAMLLSSLAPATHKLDKWYRIAILVCTAGLIVQCVRSTHFFIHGHYPVDQIFPMWVLKDIGIIILIFRFIQKARAEQQTVPSRQKPR